MRAADFCNFEYVGHLVSLTGGRGEIHEYAEMGGLHDTTLHELTDVLFGDLDADGREDAVVGIDEQSFPASGGSAWGGTRLFLVVVEEGRARVAAFGDAPPGARLSLDGTRVVAEWERGRERCSATYGLVGDRLRLAGPESCAAP